ncbi:MAG: hypothetical protein ACLFU2_13900, partial [Opitutales bacterium]
MVVFSVFGSVLALAANPVLRWNEEAVNATRLSRYQPPIAALHFATLHLAIQDTVNSFDRAHTPWLVDEAAPSGADRDAAITGAAHHVLLTLWEDAANPRNLELAYEEELAKIPPGPAREAGLAWGREVADRILAERARHPIPPTNDTYQSREPGVWRGTPPGFRPPVAPRLGEVQPFALESSSQFRAPPTLPVDSAAYAYELEEIK